MSALVPYLPDTDFSQDEANLVAGRSEVRTAQLDAELSEISSAVAALIARVSAISRDDNQLLDRVVELHTLSNAVLDLLGSNSGFNLRGGWITATAYVQFDLVTQGSGTYLCMIAHTSGVFATDLAAGRWAVLFDAATLSAAGVSFAPTGSIVASNVQAAIAEVSGDADALATSKAALAGSASQVFSVADGTDDQHAIARRQLQKNELFHIVGGGTGDAITGTIATGGVVALTDGMEFSVRAPAANTITTPTFNLTLDATATGAKAIVRGDTQGALSAGEIAAAGHELHLKYRSSLDKWLLLNPSLQNSRSIQGVGFNIAARVDAVNSDTQIDITADTLIVQDTLGNTQRVDSVNVTADITVSGVNGLDTGSEAANTWYYGYVIVKPDGTKAALLSVSATSPTMPTGYTYKARVCAVRNDAGSNFNWFRQHGNEVFYDELSQVTGLTATIATAVDISTFVPPIAIEFTIGALLQVTSSAGGIVDAGLRLYFGVAFNYWLPRFAIQGLANSQPYLVSKGPARFPGTSLTYQWVLTTGSAQTATLDILGFKLPGGGE